MLYFSKVETGFCCREGFHCWYMKTHEEDTVFREYSEGIDQEEKYVLKVYLFEGLKPAFSRGEFCLTVEDWEII